MLPRRRLVQIAILLLLISPHPLVLAQQTRITYISGEDVQLSLGGGSQVVREILGVTTSSLLEEFSSPPYADIGQWCSQNNWSYSGNYPSWWGALWLGVVQSGQISSGALQWHNWFHSIGGTIYNFSMWRDVSPGPEFDMYIPIRTWRTSGGVAGAPPLFIYFELYDKQGVRLFQAILKYDGVLHINQVNASIYNTSRSISGSWSSLDLRLWQNSYGFFFSMDNGSSIFINGTLFTPPSRVMMRFYIWEYNPIQPYSDCEFYVNIEKMELVTRTPSALIRGLSPGNWYLLDDGGRVIANATVRAHGEEVRFSNYTSPQPFSGTLVGLVNYTASIQGTFYYNSTVDYVADVEPRASKLKAAQNPPSYLTFFDDCSSTSGWSGNTRYGYYDSWGFDCQNGAIRAWFWSVFSSSASLNHWLERSVGLYGRSFTVSFTSLFSGSGPDLEARITSVSLKLSNGTYVTNSTITQLVKDAWLNVNYSFELPSFERVVGVRINIYMYGSFRPSINVYVDNLTVNYLGDPGLVVRGAPLNSVVRLYQGSNLIKTVVSNGSDILLLSSSEFTPPFNGCVVVTHRPHLIPLATYVGTLDWNDALVYSQGSLMKTSSGVQLVNVTGAGSECNTTAEWNFTYNLITGGTTPTFSTQSGFVRFDCQRIDYRTTPPWYDDPHCRAWFYLRFNLSHSVVRNLTISIYADGSFTYSSAAGYVYEQWGEIILYLVQGDNWTELIKSSRSTSPQLNTTVNVFPNTFISADAVVVAFHTYARGPGGYSLYSNPVWGRMDYLRLNYSTIPAGYAGVVVSGLQSGQYVTINTTSTLFWAASNGTAIIPFNATSWLASVRVDVYQASEKYLPTLQPGTAYYVRSYKTFSPSMDTLMYEINTTIGGAPVSYRAELKLISIAPTQVGRTVTFTLKSYLNGTLLPDVQPRVLLGEEPTSASRVGAYTYSFTTALRSGALMEVYDQSGIRLCGRLP